MFFDAIWFILEQFGEKTESLLNSSLAASHAHFWKQYNTRENENVITYHNIFVTLVITGKPLSLLSSNELSDKPSCG